MIEQEINQDTDIIVIDGMKFSREIFKSFAELSESGRTIEFTKENEVINFIEVK